MSQKKIIHSGLDWDKVDKIIDTGIDFETGNIYIEYKEKNEGMEI